MMNNPARRAAKLLAVASKGGHWEQLMLLRPALQNYAVQFATTDPELARRDGLADVMILPDANGDQPARAVKCLWVACRIVWRVRPDVVVTTGALPGLLCVVAARLIGAKTIWIDSFANSEKLSTSGKWARWLSTRALTQWEHLATPPNMQFEGRLL